MTDAQAKQINEMRMKGMGYKAIGMAIGLSRDIVRNYCKRHNLAGYATVVSKNMKLMVDGKEVCHFCGNPITQPKTGRPYVSSAGSLSFPMETRTENTAAVNVISGTDF